MLPFLLTLVRFARTVWGELKNQEFRALLGLVAVVLFTGAYFYHRVEGWGWLDSLYFSVITLTTVGYGDFAPTTGAGKLFTMLYIFLGLGLLAGFINVLGQGLMRQMREDVARRDGRERLHTRVGKALRSQTQPHEEDDDTNDLSG